MKVERFVVQSCCGKTAIIFRTDQPLTQIHLDGMVRLGFKEATHFTKAGILYVDNLDFTMMGPLGSDRLTVKCKHIEAECAQKFNNLEVLLQQVG
jgi:hypothetical protein